MAMIKRSNRFAGSTIPTRGLITILRLMRSREFAQTEMLRNLIKSQEKERNCQTSHLPVSS